MNNNPTLELLGQVNGQPVQNPPMGANQNGMMTGVDMNNPGNVPIQNNVQGNPYDSMAVSQGMNMGGAQPAMYSQNQMATSGTFGYSQENGNVGMVPNGGYPSYTQPQMAYQQPGVAPQMDYGQTANRNVGVPSYDSSMYASTQNQPQMGMSEQGYIQANSGVATNMAVAPNNAPMNGYPSQPDFSFIPLRETASVAPAYGDPNATMYQQPVPQTEQVAVGQVNYASVEMPTTYQQPAIFQTQPMDYSQMGMQPQQPQVQNQPQQPVQQPIPMAQPMGQPMPQNTGMVVPGIPDGQ